MKQPRAVAIVLTLLLTTPLTFAQNAEMVNENFFYVESVDPMSDEDTSFVYTEETNPETSLRQGSLIWRCQVGDLYLFLNADEYLGSENAMIRYRFDKQPADYPQVWDLVPAGTIAYAPSNFVRPIRGVAEKADVMAVQVTDFNDQLHTYLFTITGLTEAIKKLSCAS